MESGTLLGLEVAGVAAVLVAIGVMLGRSSRSGGLSSVIAPSLAVALIAAVGGVMVVGAGADAYLGATVPGCSTDESHPTLGSCEDPGDLKRQAGAVGLVGGLLAGVIGGCVAAWRCSRSLRTVVGGVLAAVGATVLVIESLVVLVLWAG